mmetsp:Transcript_17721/g.31002  ORF Transcript_17721/g.31002 Transcript_17721/m.31002 type:complete len:129 (+) Transcript_17721:66-452(+)|eukprot:CAMPEP_0197651574 /NCGR_PEP_ID=MMETSP1338-20131121/33146_1 /TAXON_ID=43686 ORGANISM="Pelagodinium beii, Strain RCC1491" /NCGR_SAMPLE_ID=MMETSP1338 /ASSEMBLY_ACC=CAM_ASM_000754 /LENGTH=128 /DNA_ID=CAMNT_0043226245 /DNA_START=69 /DNA_END=455 /DNA_ORIENTATION=+
MSAEAHRIVPLAERKANIRDGQLQELALDVIGRLKEDCLVAHNLGRRELTWGAIVPSVTTGSDEDMDDVLAILAAKFDRDKPHGGFQQVEWCKAKAPTEWVSKPARFGSHMQLRVFWGEDAQAYLEGA